MMRYITATLLLLTSTFYSCSNQQQCNKLELQIMDMCEMADSMYIIPLASLTDFEWDTLYVIGGPTVDDEVEVFIGMGYKHVVEDDNRQYIVAKDGKIIREYSSYCNLSLRESPSYAVGNKYPYSSSISVEKREIEGGFSYWVEEVIEQ